MQKKLTEIEIETEKPQLK